MLILPLIFITLISHNIASYSTFIQVKLWIFPEGTRNTTDEMLPFKKGAFHLALAGHLPILPVVYSSYRGFLSHKAGVFNPGG